MNPQDNQQLRALLCLPPIQPSASTALAVPEMPPQEVVTGDQEIDAVLWLQKVVATGNRGLIDKALEAAKQIRTPMKDLGRRYADLIVRQTGNAFGAALSSFGFGELEARAKRSIERAARRHEALSRFGDVDTLFTNTPAEDLCVQALHRAKRDKYHDYDNAAAMKRFDKRPALVPTTIDDCLYALAYWDSLYRLRGAAVDLAGDPLPQTYAHEKYCFAMMAKITPRDGQEAMRALDYLQEDDRSQWSDSPAIYRNLIASGWASPWVFSQDAQPDVGVEVICLDVNTLDGSIDVNTATREEGSDWMDPECLFWWMHVPPLPADEWAKAFQSALGEVDHETL